MTIERPNIFDFTDYRLFLKAFFDFEKSKGDFSYAIFAERAGFLARAHLRTVITGKRNLTPSAVSKVIVGFKMDLREAEAFRALVQFNQCQRFAEKDHYWKLFLSTRPKQNRTLVVDQYHLLAKLAYPMLLVLLKQEHINNGVEELSRLTGLTKTEVAEGLETLKSLGGLIEVAPQTYKSSGANLTTPDDIANLAVQRFHYNMMDKAKEALDLPTSEREFQSLIVALSAEEFRQLKLRIKSFFDEIEDFHNGPRPRSEKLYAINTNLIPITPDFIRQEKTTARQNSDVPLAVSMTPKETTP